MTPTTTTADPERTGEQHGRQLTSEVADVKTIHVGLMADPESPTEIAHRISDLRPSGGNGSRRLEHRGGE